MGTCIGAHPCGTETCPIRAPAGEPLLRLLVIRHGESFNNHLAVQPGMTVEKFEEMRQADPELTEMGLKQAEAMGAALHGPSDTYKVLSVVFPLGQLYVSPMHRALQTMQPLARRVDLLPHVWTDCFEVGGIYNSNIGDCKGLTRDEMERKFPTYQLPSVMAASGWYQSPIKESEPEAMMRAAKVAQNIRNLARDPKRPGGTVVLVSHAYFLNLMLRSLTGNKDRNFEHSNCAMSCLDISADGTVWPVFLNFSEHLRQPAPNFGTLEFIAA